MGACFDILSNVISAWKAKDIESVVGKLHEEIVWHYAAPRLPPVRGKDAAVVLSAERYAKLVGRKGTLMDFFRKSPLMREQAHLVLLDEASKGWEDVERGRTLSVAKVRAKYNVAKKH